MNTNKLKFFAQKARRILMEGVSRRITYYGFDAKGNVIAEPIAIPGGVIIREEIIDDVTIPAKWKALQSAIQRHGIDNVIEETSYTWFNRLMAIRILAKNNYDPTQLEYESDGSGTPVILSRARRGLVSFLDQKEQKRIQPLLGDYQNEQKAFAILITGYCHHHQLLNRIFGRLDDYTELLLPDNIIAENGFIHLLNTTDAITNEDYLKVELIGWLYQFYISEKKDEVFASFKKNKKAEAEDIPAATQIFTPNWIVKYMVQNTVGRIWLDHKPASSLRQKMKYLVESPASDDASPSTSTVSLPEGIESLKLLDPACGSGHILVEGFFHLYDMYEEEYYMPAEAVEKILQHNLYGLDIDLRAAQLAQFAVLLAAATKYPDILKKEVTTHIYAMPEPVIFNRQEILDFLSQSGVQYEKVLTKALELMEQAKNLGSVMKFSVTSVERQFFKQRLESLQAEAKTSFVIQSLLNKIQPFLQVLFTLIERYEAIAANPPYLGQKGMNDDLRNYLIKKYPTSYGDLATVFMDVSFNLLTNNGKYGMINQASWMLKPSFKDLRVNLIDRSTNLGIESLLYLGPGVFEEIKGEVVQSVCFIITKRSINFTLMYKLNHFKGSTNKRDAFLENQTTIYRKSIKDFDAFEGKQFGFWLRKELLVNFDNSPIQKFGDARQGIKTGENSNFIRYWHEVSKFKFEYKWFPVEKGGEFRKWFGNNDYVLNWGNDGYEIKNFKNEDGKLRSRPQNLNYFFCDGITWSTSAGQNPSFRYSSKKFAFESSGSKFFILTSDYFIEDFIGFFNSKVTKYIIEVFAPGIGFSEGSIKALPFLDIIHELRGTIRQLSSESIRISKHDWDNNETSWDFNTTPLFGALLGDIDMVKSQFLNSSILSALKDGASLQEVYDKYVTRWSSLFYKLHSNEEELNRIFIDIYGLNQELDPIVPLKDITILQEELDEKILKETNKALRTQRQWKLIYGKWELYVDKMVPLPKLPIKRDVVMKQFISYAIGCMMGRYSPDTPGLILANPGETIKDYFDKVGREEVNSFLPDDDGIIPMMGSNCGFSDDVVLRLRHFMEVVWGSENLVQNINFLQACLDMEIEKYLISQNNFWKDHYSRYKKKPIYWLFSSKKGAFQVLVYMHRMNRFTVQKIRENYMFKHLQWLTNQKADQERRSSSLTREETRQLDYYRTALNECQEYDLHLKNIADQQIEFDLDDGVSVNYAKFEPLLAAIK